MKRLRDRWRDWRRGYTDGDVTRASYKYVSEWTPSERRAAADNEGLRHLLEEPPPAPVWGPSGINRERMTYWDSGVRRQEGLIETYHGWSTQQRFLVPPPSDDALIAARLAMEELIERNILEQLIGGNPTPGMNYVQYLDENNVIRTRPVGIPYIDPWSA